MTWHIQEAHIFFNPRYPQRERHALVHPALLRWIAAEAPQTIRILDVGCGTGRLTLAVAPLAAEVIGLDRDGAALMLGQQRTAVANIANVRFLEADVEDLPYSSLLGAGSIGMVVANLCMSQAIMARAHAILPVGGCLIFAALHSAQWQETGRASRFAYDAHELRQFLDRNGWQCEAMEIDREVLHLQQVPDSSNILWLKMDSRELISHRLFRVTCLASGTCSIEANGRYWRHDTHTITPRRCQMF